MDLGLGSAERSNTPGTASTWIMNPLQSVIHLLQVVCVCACVCSEAGWRRSGEREDSLFSPFISVYEAGYVYRCLLGFFWTPCSFQSTLYSKENLEPSFRHPCSAYNVININFKLVFIKRRLSFVWKCITIYFCRFCVKFTETVLHRALQR